MILVPKITYAQYLNFLNKNHIAADQFQEYLKWLRYFLDFCDRHVITPDRSERLRLFQEKLNEKKQSPEKCQRAAHAVTLYFEMQGQGADSALQADTPDTPPHLIAMPSRESLPSTVSQRKSQFNDTGYQEKSDSAEWDAVMEAMANEIKVRHYSRKTLKTYANWSRQFQRFREPLGTPFTYSHLRKSNVPTCTWTLSG